MSSESERRFSMEELKQLNKPQALEASMPPPPPMIILPEADWNTLLNQLDRLEAQAAAQEALLRALSQQVGQLPTQEQAEALARAVARELDLPVRGTLEKFRNNGPQSHLHEASERRANVLGVYRLKESVDLAGLRVLLVDDVVTSGATLSECARLLRQAGAAQVFCLTLAQAGPARREPALDAKINRKNG